MFRDELFDFERDFARAVLRRVDEWRREEGWWKKLLRSFVNGSDVYCVREKKRKKKSVEKRKFF